MSTRPFIIANWKMNLLPDEASQAMNSLVACQKRYSKGLERYSLIVCPSHESISRCNNVLGKKSSPIALGGQDCFWHDKGAFTGEISPISLERLGCTYCILGHSERREILGETDAMIQKKVAHLCAATSLTPIVCVGESRKERNSGRVRSVLKRQLRSALSHVPRRRHVVVAYEPIWAIGARHPITPKECAVALAYIHEQCQGLGIPRMYRAVVYGGSVTHDTVLSFLTKGVSDGVLVGGASSKSAEFHSLLRTIAKIV
ncbi:triosephosphate isomerase [Candidatus Uhrbacteria bacterium]|nr:triosephosphate isomerase [Candidatus Uhrbacteria bacterium]